MRACLTFGMTSTSVANVVGPSWPDADGQPLLFLIDASSRFERRLLRDWVAATRPEGVAADDVSVASIPKSRRHRAGDWLVNPHLRERLALGDEQASGIILDVWARAFPASLAKQDLDVELSRERQDAQGTCQVLLAKGVRLLDREQHARAVLAFRKAIRVARQAGVCNAYTLPAETWLVTALRRQIECLEPYEMKQRGKLLRQAVRATRRA